MNQTFKIVAVLTLVCVACGFCLSFVYSVAEERIEINARKQIEDAITALAPQASRVEEVSFDAEVVYKLIDDDDLLVGYGFMAEGQGYQDKIKILAVIEPSLIQFQGIEVIESKETPGLGAKINEPGFKSQFNGLKVRPNLQVKAITGATVTSRAVVNILQQRIARLKQQLNR
jgi:electron transport complex protein RnfG